MTDNVDAKTKAALLDALGNAKRFTQKLQERKEKQLWKKVEFPCSLHDALSRLTKNELDQIRRNYQFKGLSALKKAELASELSKSIPITFKMIVDLLDQDRYDRIKKIVKHSGVIADNGLPVAAVETYMSYSLLFPGITGRKRVLFMPTELIGVFESHDDGELRAKVRRNTEWIQLAHGLLHYFGVMDIWHLMQKIEELTEKPVDRVDFLRVLHASCDFYKAICPASFGFRDSRVFDAEKILDEQHARPDVDDYPFTKSQLMRAADPNYVDETPQINALMNFLVSEYHISDQERTELIKQIIAIIQTDANPSKVIQFLQTRMDFPSFAFVQALLAKVTNVYNHTRQGALKGHTPHEVFQKEKRHLKPVPDQPLAPIRSQTPIFGKPSTSNTTTHHKVGRNDPCPCGSGKKYKKCCGRS
ncbi:YecA family protein [Sporolactobacillus terrae]|uniref:YecA family protein n=1 Tax=Sporolactobacillus terrae TaxID=269673 RepID=UPI001119FB67|nr:SEC-C metal-binding domain-containing protein [Sporolactobacillus terrae]